MQIPSQNPYQNATHIYPKIGRAADPKDTVPAKANLATGSATPAAGTLNASSVATLHQTLDALPAVRPETVARGKALVADATYPPLVLINKLADLFITDAQGNAASSH